MNDEHFGQMLSAARPKLHRFAMRLCFDHTQAEDLVSETMLKAWNKRESFAEGTNFIAWTHMILRNHYLSQMRRKRWDGGSIDDMLASALPSIAAPQGVVVELSDTLKALDLIPRDMREAMLLVGAGASYEEAAEELCVSVGTIKSRVARGRDALREVLA